MESTNRRPLGRLAGAGDDRMTGTAMEIGRMWTKARLIAALAALSACDLGGCCEPGLSWVDGVCQ